MSVMFLRTWNETVGQIVLLVGLLRQLIRKKKVFVVHMQVNDMSVIVKKFLI